MSENEAGQVSFDYDAEEINSARKLIRVLTKRFGGTEQADKYRLEVKYRRRKPGESLRTLHAEIRKLVKLAFPKLEHKARELMACDYFIDSLNDPNQTLKVRERSPKDLDLALKIALQLEVWANNAERTKQEQQPKEPPRDRKLREVVDQGPNKQVIMAEAKQAVESRAQKVVDGLAKTFYRTLSTVYE